MNVALLLRTGLILLAVFQVSRGMLLVETAPGIEVFWEGVLLGPTGADGRLRIRDIPLGSYVLTFRGRGWIEQTHTVTVSAGLNRFGVDLVPVRADPDPAPVGSTPPPPAPPKSPPVAATRPAAKPEVPGPAPGQDSAAAVAQSTPAGPNSPPVDLGNSQGSAALHSALSELPQALDRPRSSQVARAEVNAFSSAVFLLVAVLLGLTFWLIRSSNGYSATVADSRPPLVPPEHLELPPDNDPRLQTKSFLAEIRAREHAMDEGTEVFSPRRQPAIPVDPESIRVVDEEPE